MVWIPGGTYTRGNDRNLGTTATYPEEQPAHKVTVDGFWLDATEVTNRQFMKFADETGYKTQAETGWSKEDFPKAPPDQLKPGCLVFSAPEGQVDLWQPGSEWSWWRFVEGAGWRHPTGPGSSIEDKMDHPVVCVTKEDAEAYCKWAGRRLPTEAEWERAARGGLEDAVFTWGDDPVPDGKWLANIFQGEFPHNNTALDGFAGTSPVKSFPPNGYGLYDMAGNVWEICSDLYRPDYYRSFARDPQPNPTGPTLPVDEPRVRAFQQSGEYPEMMDPPHPLSYLWVSKGGSHLCHHSYCLRYRPAARHYAESLSPTNHAGFRTAKSP
ncbi:MAG: formylglycine-generating enzyme family protein [Akkermansiaceae bacterium]|nr:formylglycine-generating enzyme family protein [Akkermansiaceae bacterium]